jgi:hypothetical protein
MAMEVVSFCYRLWNLQLPGQRLARHEGTTLKHGLNSFIKILFAVSVVFLHFGLTVVQSLKGLLKFY